MIFFNSERIHVIFTSCRNAFLVFMEIGLFVTTWKLAAKNAGSNGLD